MFQYYIKIVPTMYVKSNGTTIHTNQFSVTRHSKSVSAASGESGMPGIFFSYELSSLMVKYTEREGWVQCISQHRKMFVSINRSCFLIIFQFIGSFRDHCVRYCRWFILRGRHYRFHSEQFIACDSKENRTRQIQLIPFLYNYTTSPCLDAIKKKSMHQSTSRISVMHDDSLPESRFSLRTIM